MRVEERRQKKTNQTEKEGRKKARKEARPITRAAVQDVNQNQRREVDKRSSGREKSRAQLEKRNYETSGTIRSHQSRVNEKEGKGE